jgi:pimeloyl-ACP methyl ester carboxylesterase
MGGYVAWQFAGKYPDRLRALILCDTKVTADPPETVKTRHETAEKALAEGPEFLTKAMPPKLFAPETLRDQPRTVERAKELMRDASPEGIAAASRGMAERPDMTTLLARITVPTLVLCGEHDQITTSKEMRTIAETIAGAHYKEIAKAGHLAPLEQPAAVNDAIARFLKSISAK